MEKERCLACCASCIIIKTYACVFWAWSPLLGSTCETEIAQLDYLVPISFTTGIMMSVKFTCIHIRGPLYGREDLALYHWCSLLDSWVFNVTNRRNRIFFPHKSYWIVLPWMLQVHEVGTPRNRSSVRGSYRFIHHERNSKWCIKKAFLTLPDLFSLGN